MDIPRLIDILIPSDVVDLRSGRLNIIHRERRRLGIWTSTEKMSILNLVHWVDVSHEKKNKSFFVSIMRFAF